MQKNPGAVEIGSAVNHNGGTDWWPPSKVHLRPDHGGGIGIHIG
jgi:hypothetical protein